MKRWLLHVRTSGRLALILRLSVIVPGGILALWWSRALLHAMGANNYGLIMAFQGVLGLAGLGDFGIGGALQIRTMRHLAHKQTTELHLLHATARALMLSMAAIGLPLFLLLSPWLPQLLKFVETPASGSLFALFVVGGFYSLFTFLSGYYLTTLYSVGTISWTVLPPVLVFHLSSAFQLICALHHTPLWIQMTPSVILAAGCLILYYQMVRASHPDLCGPLPLKFVPSYVKALLHTSFWAYLFCISYVIYTTTDRLMVNAGFGASQVTSYQLNYKLCEMTLPIIIGVGFVFLPKIVIRIVSPEQKEKLIGRAMAEKLRKLQTFLGCAVSITYLAVNTLFVRWWFGPQASASFDLQAAFAFTLLLSVSSESAIQLWGRISESALQKASTTVVLSALVNLGLSYVAMKIGWIEGIAWATWIARAFFAAFAIRAVSAEFEIPVWRWLANVFLVPTILLAISICLKELISPQTALEWIVLAVCNLILLVISFFICGLRPSLFREELIALKDVLRVSGEKA